MPDPVVRHGQSTAISSPVDIGLELFVFGDPPPSSGTIPYAALESFEGPKPTERPAGPYALLAASAVGDIGAAFLQPGGAEFEYATGALLGSESSFTVPEPAAHAAGLAGVAVLAALAAPRRRPLARSARAIEDGQRSGPCPCDRAGS